MYMAGSIKFSFFIIIFSFTLKFLRDRRIVFIEPEMLTIEWIKKNYMNVSSVMVLVISLLNYHKMHMVIQTSSA